MDRMEKIVFKTLEEQSNLISKSFKEMGVAISAYFEGDDETLQKSVLKIRNHEKQSIKLKHQNLETVAQAVSIYRSDFFRLVMKMNEVQANQAGSTVRLGNIRYSPRPDDEMIPKFKQLVEVFVKMGDTLHNLMKKLGDDMHSASEFCTTIDEIEDNVDNIYRDLHGHLYNRADIPLRIIMQYLSVAKHIEEACDSVASVADSVRIILATH